MSIPRIGLVLGGGGARGISHIAAIEALDELGLKPVAVAGSSMGGIVGAGVAAGMPAQEIRERLIAAFGTRGTVASRLWSIRPRSLVGWIGGDIGFGKLDPVRVIEAFVGDGFPHTFEDLALPFAVVATDYYAGIEAHISRGPLMQALGASAALPGLFKPVTIDGRVMVDGSILNPVPVDALPIEVDLKIAVDVISYPEPRDGEAGPSAFAAMMGSAQLMMQQIMMPKLERHPPDLLVRPPIGAIHVMDFLKVREIIDLCSPIKEDIKRKLTRMIEHPELRVIEDGRADRTVVSA